MRLVEDYEELVALNRALIEVKFSGGCKDKVLPFSTFIANISNRVVDEIINQNEQGRGNKLATASDWVNWRTMKPEQPEWKAVLQHIKQMSVWPNSSCQEKKEFVKWLAAPFTLSDLLLEQLISEGDEVIKDSHKSKK